MFGRQNKTLWSSLHASPGDTFDAILLWINVKMITITVAYGSCTRPLFHVNSFRYRF